jgi:hypothetical protein
MIGCENGGARAVTRRAVIKAATVALIAASLPVTAAAATAATVLYDDRVLEITRTLADPDDLWVVPEDMTRIGGFVLRGTRICLDAVCVPAPPNSDIRITRSRQTWISLTELARQLKQAVAVDADRGVWSFGEVPARRASFLESAMAPDFSLPNRQGQQVRLSDFRGKKVLLVTWASW